MAHRGRAVSARRSARARRTDVLLLPGGVQISDALLDPSSEAWVDDPTDMAEIPGSAGREVLDAACWLGRRHRHREAVRAWAVEHGWTNTRGRVDIARVLAAGIPLPGFELDEDGRVRPKHDEQRALYLLLAGAG